MAVANDKPSRGEPLVIAHRGASAYRPEHTLSAYRLAIGMGADYIEPDLVSTKDGVLVARHENEIGGTTDVAEHPEFASRRTTKVIDLARSEGVGIYPETKHPTYHDSIDLSLEQPLVAALKANGLDERSAPVFVQSFEVANLQELDRMLRVPLVQLTSARGRPYDFTQGSDPRTYADITSPAGLREVADYADGLGPDKSQIVPRDAQNRLTAPTTLVDDAHRAGLVVHPYTFRPENEFLPEDYREGDPASPEYRRARGDQPAELALFYRLGVDGVFADNPDTAVAVRERVFRDRGRGGGHDGD